MSAGGPDTGGMPPTTGFVALLDVLGFTSLVLRGGDGRDLAGYVRAVKARAQAEGVECVLFSDSIVLTVPGGHLALPQIARACSFIFGELLELGVPIRGAISHGRYFRESGDGSVFIAGRPVIEAYHLEKAQDWVGIALAPSVVELADRAGSPVADSCRRTNLNTPEDLDSVNERLGWVLSIAQAFIPWHAEPGDSGRQWDGFAVLPTVPVQTIEAMPDHLRRSIRALERLRQLAPDPNSQRKYNCTLGWLRPLADGWAGHAFQLSQLKASAAKGLGPEPRT